MFGIQVLTSAFLSFLFFGSCFYLLMCVDPHSKGPLAKLHQLLFIQLPKKLQNATGGENSKISKFFSKIFNYFFYSNHPIVQIFYILIAVGGYILYYYQGIYQHFPNSMVSVHHHWISLVLALTCFYSYYLACTTKPGIITKQNYKEYVKKYEKYYDDITFERNKECATCKIIKPARSKHCKVTDVCVSKFDHYCIWIRQSVGEKNYKNFLSFIGLHSVLCLYGTYIGFNCFRGIIQDQGLLTATFRGYDGQMFKADYTIVFKYLFMKETLFIFMVILCSIMGVTLFLFFCYHLSMVAKNVTTNEKIKKGDFMEFQKKQIKYLQKVMNDKKDLSQNDVKDIEKKIDQMTKDYEILKQGNPEQGLMKNLKIIFSQK